MLTCPYCFGGVGKQVASTWFKCQSESCGQFFENRRYQDDFHRQTQETSIEAKKEIEESGEAESQRQFVFDTIRKNPNISIREISLITGLQKSSISPRLNELRTQKRVVQSGWKKIDKIEVMIWKEALRL